MFFYDVYTYLYVLKHDVVRLDPAFAVNWECSETIAIPQHPWKFQNSLQCFDFLANHQLQRSSIKPFLDNLFFDGYSECH